MTAETTTTSKAVSKRMLNDRGSDLAEGLTLNPLPFSGSAKDLRAAWEHLPSDEAKSEAIAEFLARLDRLFTHDWAMLYEFIKIIRDTPHYWLDRGYATFEAFWSEHGRFAFERLSDLESQTGFGSLACPGLFSSSGRLGDPTDETNTGPRPTILPADVRADERSQLLWRLDLDNETHEYKRGFLDGRQAGSRCLRLRFRRLKQQFPRIAARVLSGEFFRRPRSGTWRIDLGAAEAIAGIEPKPRSSISPVDRAAKYFQRLSDDERNAFFKTTGIMQSLSAERQSAE